MKVAGVDVTRRDLGRIALLSTSPLLGGVNLVVHSHGVERVWWIVGVVGTALVFFGVGVSLQVLRRRDEEAGRAGSPPSGQ